MSVEYYTRFERGDLSTASPEMLRSLAHALRLDKNETLHLGLLARASRGETAATTVTPEIQSVLDAVNTPAWVRNKKMDILAVNSPARELYAPIFEAIPERPNTARHLYLTQSGKTFWRDRDLWAGAFAASLRMQTAASPDDEDLRQLIRELESSPDFREHFHSGDVLALTHGLKRFDHPTLGQVDYRFETFTSTSAPGQVLSVYT